MTLSRRPSPPPPPSPKYEYLGKVEQFLGMAPREMGMGGECPFGTRILLLCGRVALQSWVTVWWALVGVAGLVLGSLALAVPAAVLGLGAVAVTVGELHATTAGPGAGAPGAPRAPAAVHRQLQEATRSC